MKRDNYVRRQFLHILFALFFIAVWILLGTLGYIYFAQLSAIDAFVNACMIGGGMGPVSQIDSFWGKIFTSIYAVLSGIVFITNVGILFTPMAHRIFKKMDLE